MLKLTAALVTIAIAATAQASGWRSLRIDAGSEARFADSVATFREALSPVREYVFLHALQDVWLAGTERAAAQQREFTERDYLRELDGLAYKDVIRLTDPTGGTALSRQREAYAHFYRQRPPLASAPVPAQQPGPIGFSGEQVRGFDNQRQAMQERLANQGRL